MASGFLVTLDAGEHAVRCRGCPWRSGGHRTLQSAIQAFDGHRSSSLHASGHWASSRDQAGAWDARPCPQAPARHHRRRPMPRIPDPALRAVFEDPDLSLAAKGALAVILTRPSGARVSPEYLFSSSSDPMTVVSKAVRELARTGLVGTAKAGRAGGGIRSR